jgi:hypothetical protein
MDIHLPKKMTDPKKIEWLVKEHAYCSHCGQRMQWVKIKDFYDTRTGKPSPVYEWECFAYFVAKGDHDYCSERWYGEIPS